MDKHIKKENRVNKSTNTSNGIRTPYNGLYATVSTYLDKGKYYYMPNRTLARLIFDKNPDLASVENIRRAILDMKGLNGKAALKKNICGGKYYLSAKDKEVKFVSPVSLAIERKPFYLPLNKRVGCLFDAHVPYHDNRAVDAAVNSLLKNNVKIVLMQEMFDFYWQSKFNKNPIKPPFKEEKEVYIDFMYELVSWFPEGTLFYYQEGNHDERWQHYLIRSCPEISLIDDFAIENVFKYTEMGINYIKDKTLIKIGKLNCIHGHEKRGTSVVNPARGLWLKFSESTICGHSHFTSQHTVHNKLSNELKACWSVGCLSELQPDYDVYSTYNHGFAIIDTDNTGYFEVQNKSIFNGKIL